MNKVLLIIRSGAIGIDFAIVDDTPKLYRAIATCEKQRKQLEETKSRGSHSCKYFDDLEFKDIDELPPFNGKVIFVTYLSGSSFMDYTEYEEEEGN